MFALLSCCSGPDGESDRDAGSAPPAAAGELATSIDTIEVVLDDYVFGIPQTLVGGELVLRVSNEGIEEHDLMFTQALGDSAVWRLPARLEPGRTATYTLVLEPGSYQVVCDFAGHVGRGMITTVTVEDPLS